MRVIVDADSVEAGVLAARDEVGDFGDRQAHRAADDDLQGGAADEYLALAREGVLNGPVELRGLHGLEEPVPDAEVPAALAVLFRPPPAGDEDHGDVRVPRAHALGHSPAVDPRHPDVRHHEVELSRRAAATAAGR